MAWALSNHPLPSRMRDGINGVIERETGIEAGSRQYLGKQSGACPARSGDDRVLHGSLSRDGCIWSMIRKTIQTQASAGVR